MAIQKSVFSEGAATPLEKRHTGVDYSRVLLARALCRLTLWYVVPGTVDVGGARDRPAPTNGPYLNSRPPTPARQGFRMFRSFNGPLKTTKYHISLKQV